MSESTVTKPPSVGELAEMIAAQRSVVEALRPCSGEHCARLLGHEQTLELLEEELRRRMPLPPPINHSPFDAAG